MYDIYKGLDKICSVCLSSSAYHSRKKKEKKYENLTSYLLKKENRDSKSKQNSYKKRIKELKVPLLIFRNRFARLMFRFI